MLSERTLLCGPKLTIFLGEFGSGKTELAINYALQTKRLGCKTVLVDMDIHKPYFHSRDQRECLEAKGIEVIGAEKRFGHTELPVLPNGLLRVIQQPDYRVLIDVGGGDSAIVLKQFLEKLTQSSYEASFVVNMFRPFTDTIEKAITVLHRLEAASGLTITNLISNANIGQATTNEHIDKGISFIEQLSRKIKRPIHSVVVNERLGIPCGLKTQYPVFTLKPFTQYPWEK